MKPTTAQIERWIKQAERDLEAARRQLAIEVWEQCALLCEQAVEKYLKALYMQREGQEAPKTHKIADLASSLGAPNGFYALLQQLETDYLATRYPDTTVAAPFEGYTEQIARDRLNGATEVIEWARRQMQSNN